MERVEAKIGNSNQPLFGGTDPDRVYYSAFGDTRDADKNLLPCGEDIQDQKEVEVNEDYIEALDNYIGEEVVIPGKYYIPVLARVKIRKQDALGNPIGEEHINHLLDTRIYELEFPDRRVYEYPVIIIIENPIDQIDNQGWNTGILEEILAFRCDTDVAITTGDQSYTNINGIQHPVITTKDRDVKVKCRYQSTDWFPLHLIKE